MLFIISYHDSGKRRKVSFGGDSEKVEKWRLQQKSLQESQRRTEVKKLFSSSSSTGCYLLLQSTASCQLSQGKKEKWRLPETAELGDERTVSKTEWVSENDQRPEVFTWNFSSICLFFFYFFIIIITISFVPVFFEVLLLLLWWTQVNRPFFVSTKWTNFLTTMNISNFIGLFGKGQS